MEPDYQSLWNEYQSSQAPVDNKAAPDYNALWQEYQKNGVQSEQPSNKGFIGRESQDLSSRFQNMQETAKRGLANEQNIPIVSSAIQNAGNALGAGYDFAGNIIGSSARGYGDLAKLVAPEISDTIAQDAMDASKYVGNSMVGKAAESVGDAISNAWDELGPGTKADVSGLGNILAAPEVGGKALQIAGKALTESGDATAEAIQKQAALEGIQKKQTNKVMEKAVGDTGINYETGKANYTPKDEDVAKTALQVPGVDFVKNNLQENHDLLDNAYSQKAEDLKEKLNESGVIVSPKEFHARLDNFENQVLKSTDYTSTEKNSVSKAVDEMKGLTAGEDGQLPISKILSARQKLDKTFLTASGDLTSGAEKVYRDSLKPVRDIANNFVAAKVPEADVLTSLKEQHHLKSAIDNIAEKIPAEAKETANAPGLFGRVGEHWKGIVSGSALLGGAHQIPLIGGALDAAAPYVAGIYGAYKAGTTGVNALKNPAVRQALGATLSATGKVMRGGKELTLKDISTKDIANMTPEVRQLLLTGPSSDIVRGAKYN